MKNLVLLTTAAFLTFPIFSQSLEYTYWFARPTQAIQDLHVLPGGKVMMAGTSQFRSGGILVVDTNSMFYHAELLGYEGPLNIKLGPTSDGGCIVAAYVPHCDIYLPGIWKYNSSWDVEWQISSSPLPFFSHPKKIQPLSDGSYVVAASANLIKISASGALGWVKTFNPPLKDIAAYANGTIYAASTEGLIGIDANGNVLFTNTAYPFEKIAFHPASGHIVGYNNSTVTVLDTAVPFF